MRKLFAMVLIAICVIWIIGCDLPLRCDKDGFGYHTTMLTEKVSFSDVNQLELLLMSNGFSILIKEREAISRGYKNDTYKIYVKKLNDKPFYYIDVYIFYIKDEQNKTMQHLETRVGNDNRGAVIPEIKNEIEYYSDLIYRQLNKDREGLVSKTIGTVTPLMCQ